MLGDAELNRLLCSKLTYCTSVDEKYSRTRHVLSAIPTVFAYMYTSNTSFAYSGDAGSVMKMPPLLATPLGAVSPLPTVAVRSDASHQLGCACSVTDGSVTLDTSAAFALSRSATDALATPLLVNHDTGNDVQLQYAT